MKKIRIVNLSLIAILTFVLSLSSSVAFAAEGHLDWNNFAYRVGNLVIFIALIYFFAGKKILAFFQERKERILHDFESIAHEKKQIETTLHEIKEKLKHVEEERTAILIRAEEEAFAIKNTMLEEAHIEAKKILDYANKKMFIEQEKMKQMLITELSQRIYEEVEKELTQKLSLSTQKQILHNSIKKVVAFEKEINSKTLC